MDKLKGVWLVGVSTGPDSMALLNMAVEAGIEVAIAFVNYGLRAQANEEEKYIKEYAKNNNIKCHILNEEFKYVGNFEAAARKWRYDFYISLIKENNYEGILLGHHQDDLIETYIMQEEKQLTPSYYGIKEEMIYEGIIVKRPLLKYKKEELIEYCKKKGIRYFIDETNNENEYTRNRIRHEIVEKLSENERLLILKEIEKKNAIKRERDCRINAYIKNDEIDLALYKSLDKEDRLYCLRLLSKDIKNYSEAHLINIDDIIMHNNDFLITLDDKNIIAQKDNKCFRGLRKNKYCDIYNTLEELKDIKKDNYYIEEGKLGTNALTLDEKDFPITIRNYEEGDVIEMRFGRKKINRFFIDRKIAKCEREVWPVVLNAKNEVILVPGLGCDIRHYSIKPSISVIQYY